MNAEGVPEKMRGGEEQKEEEGKRKGKKGKREIEKWERVREEETVEEKVGDNGKEKLEIVEWV